MNILKLNYQAILLLILLSLLVPFVALGHGLGVSYEETVGEYSIDIGYEPEAITSESRVRFDFGIFDKTTGEEVEYSDLWLRINEGNQTVFASGIHSPEFGTAGALYVFPGGGSYEVSVRFQNGGDQLAEVSFPVEVADASESSSSTSTLIVAGLIGVVLGGLSAFILGRRKDA